MKHEQIDQTTAICACKLPAALVLGNEVVVLFLQGPQDMPAAHVATYTEKRQESAACGGEHEPLTRFFATVPSWGDNTTAGAATMQSAVLPAHATGGGRTPFTPGRHPMRDPCCVIVPVCCSLLLPPLLLLLLHLH